MIKLLDVAKVVVGGLLTVLALSVYAQYKFKEKEKFLADNGCVVVTKIDGRYQVLSDSDIYVVLSEEYPTLSWLCEDAKFYDEKDFK